MKHLLSITFALFATTMMAQNPTRSEAVLVNGKKIYYEAYGEGKPLFLLHGYTLSSQSWLPYVADFDDEYEVYLVDLTGHGRSDSFSEDLSVSSVAEDLDSLIKYLKLDQIRAIGFSFGGDVLYQLALLNPPLIESMITIGAVGTWTVEDFPQYREAFTFENRANFSWLEESHGSDEKIRALMDQFSNYIVEVTDDELKSIKPEVLIMVGDDDEGIELEEIARVRKHLPKSDLWILPNVAHGAHEGETKDEFVLKSRAFFAKEK